MATKKKKKKLTKAQVKNRNRKIFLISEFIVLLLVLLAFFAWLKLGKIDWATIKNMKTNTLDEETKVVLSGYTTLAFFGVDNRKVGNYDSGNSDSIMIACINNDTKEVRIVSVYRDTFLDTGEGNLHKCNYAYNHGGIEQAMEMLNSNLDLDIQDYVAVDFKALADAVDAVGGIDLEDGLTGEEAAIMNQSYVSYTAEIVGKEGKEVKQGQKHLDGVQALSFCRVRYTKGGDFERASRQREVLGLLAEKMKAASLTELNNLVDAILPEVSTSLYPSEVFTLATAMQDYTIVETRGFPFDMRGGKFGSKGDVVVPCTLESNVQKLYEYLYADTTHISSNELKSISESIVTYTGFDEDDALDYGY